ncbi:metalloregulator ArsR/SmtB family transcription factor [Gordonia sp. SID5947]|uniref:ArsR/SmtB family transcription factor n=1 Tax=Gordonia sp. SID5947 TaxID=2690315 RepID=UPI00136BD74F|nr:helix-turn-helix transcriptional regulator [Gordonia sp. SID5947]MYR06422.1 metalloregulator ArsR/SmtB family transcription factor [Gordonia sp. SID5947]
MSDNRAAQGEPDIADVASAFADPRRARVLMALADGRALPAGRLAEEAGVSASTISSHLSVLSRHDLVAVEQQGRHRYYRLATSDVEGVLEALARLAPRTPITSLRAHTRAHAVRTGRTCYRHLAGQVGVDLFQRFVGAGWITGGDGLHHPEVTGDRLSSTGKGDQYRLSVAGAEALSAWGIESRLMSTSRPLRYCVDWTEQAHHLAGPLGTAITERLFDLGWIVRNRVPRSVDITSEGEARLASLAPPASSPIEASTSRVDNRLAGDHQVPSAVSFRRR